MNWIHFNDNDTKEGVEGRYYSPSPHRATFYINGTDHPGDWKNNFSVWGRTEIENGVKVNTKDLREAQWVVEYITSRFDMERLTHLTLSGHSRGASIASIVLWKIDKQFPHIQLNGILFAPKRTGNLAFVRAVSPYCVGYRHKGDIVPFLPTWPRYRNVELNVFGEWKLFAHPVRYYRTWYDKYDLR